MVDPGFGPGFLFGRLGEKHHGQGDAQYDEPDNRDQKMQDAAVHASLLADSERGEC
jgi:hypothetical protein